MTTQNTSSEVETNIFPTHFLLAYHGAKNSTSMTSWSATLLAKSASVNSSTSLQLAKENKATKHSGTIMVLCLMRFYAMLY